MVQGACPLSPDVSEKVAQGVTLDAQGRVARLDPAGHGKETATENRTPAGRGRRFWIKLRSVSYTARLAEPETV